jgi:hypothetical protein
MEEKLKDINYRGGIVKFKIPVNWVEHYEEDGGGTFYEDAPNTGTLRLNVLTVKAPADSKGNLSVEALSIASSSEPNNIEILSNGNALTRSIERTKEQGQKITLYWWFVAKTIPPNYVRVANFSYTILTSQENIDTFKNEFKLLDEQIKNCEFHPELGEL